MTHDCPRCHSETKNGQAKCTQCGASLQQSRPRTVVENIPKVRRKTLIEKPSEKPTSQNFTTPFYPISRQPVARLVALDDGSTTQGEIWRLRNDIQVIGRTDGLIRIENDPDISERHVEISCRWRKDQFSWYLTDLDSECGTFVRAKRMQLIPGRQLLLGGLKFEFRNPAQQADSKARADHSKSRHAPEPVESPSLIQLPVDPNSTKISIYQNGFVIGSDYERCDAVVDDPFVCRIHAQLNCDDAGNWFIEDQKSINGVWVQIKRIELRHKNEFQLGQQRFVFHLPKRAEPRHV